MKTVNPYAAQLQSKLNEVTASLRNRAPLTLETSAEETEQIVLKDQRDLAALAVDQDTRLLRELRAAQARLASGTFGICEDCDAAIPDRRLRAIPWARRCVSCQEQEDRTQQQPSSFRPLWFAA